MKRFIRIETEDREILQSAVRCVLREELISLAGKTVERIAWDALDYAIATGRLQGGREYINTLHGQGIDDGHIERVITFAPEVAKTEQRVDVVIRRDGRVLTQATEYTLEDTLKLVLKAGGTRALNDTVRAIELADRSPGNVLCVENADRDHRGTHVTIEWRGVAAQ